ncbi:uncharacterized protein MICPUCDRAFT_60148 [Micromonas pusilla CCMP1545]|uniref:Predicted protein n=1 Tax=Micromonas pusilla (strain CCMP1545) TaxID=564608 RepID=C1MXG3_MICPC|nr:uncharacterized protein MICPUCDRAFT_60148 [Micromonas pusilla CCMP1545]EEH55457.1 predicted protein [Micromonas pusilla CCMP1545]|eukprot:XP_003060688.1 predicted protein [Micromonas pusilla CCMP1545]
MASFAAPALAARSGAFARPDAVRARGAAAARISRGFVAAPGKSNKQTSMRRRVAPTTRAAASGDGERDDQPDNWELKYLYDGGCTVCNSLVKLLKSKRGHEKIWFEDIAAPTFAPDKNEGITFEEAMATIHVIKSKDNSILTGMDALTSLYDITGMGWLFKLAKLPVLSTAANVAYKMVSKNRQSMGSAADGLLALGRINMEEKGEGSCTDLEGECREKPPPVDEAADAAAKAAEERRAKIAAENAKNAAAATAGAAASANPVAKTGQGGLETAAQTPAAPTSGSLSDRRNILGVYDSRVSRSDKRAIRAAPVDTETGRLIDELITVPLEDSQLSTIAAAMTSIIKHFGWQGNVGIGLPGREIEMDQNVNETFDASDFDSVDGTFDEPPSPVFNEKKKATKTASGAGANARLADAIASTNAEVSGSRQSRLEIETYLRNATGRDVVVMSGPEATGFGEMRYGPAGAGDGTTVCVTLGKSIGVSLFDGGILAHNPADVEKQISTWNRGRWRDSALPRPPGEMEGDAVATDEDWARWAERVQHYLSRIEAVAQPDRFIICGRASVSFEKWVPMMKPLPGATPVLQAQQGLTAAVEGAAVGASEILTLRRDTARVRAAIGHQKGLSPQKLTDEQVGAVFDEFDEDGSGTLTIEELNNAIGRLNIKLTDVELKELFVEMDSEVTGDIRRNEFVGWWRDSIGSSSVEIIHTMEEFNQVLDDADGTDQMTVLMVGVTYCKPCKAFTKKYADFAERFSAARFIKVFGNENKDMTILCRDELKVKSTPTFYFFRNKDQVHMHTGANAGKFEKNILEKVREGEPGYGSARLFEDPVEKEGEKKPAPAR